MKKFYFSLFGVLLLLTTSTSVFACTDLTSNVARYQEDSQVLSLQSFLYEKGYLKAKPNGYFGAGTFAAVKSFQKDKGISQVGSAGPATRAAIKKDSCGTSTTTTKVSTPTVSATTSATTTKPVATTTPAISKGAARNIQRFTDVENIIKALAQYFADSRGVHSVATFDTPIEICTATSTGASSTCSSLANVNYLVPSYLPKIPVDPSLSQTSIGSGYTLTRSLYNDITIAAKSPEEKAIVRVRCNFDTGCTKITKISQEEYNIPYVTALERTIVLKEALPKKGIIVTGRNFTKNNTVILQSKSTQKEYIAGTYPSEDGKTFTLSATTTNSLLSCGEGCQEKLGTGEYSVRVKNEGGSSNLVYMTVKGFATATISTRADATVIASSTNVKLATISVSTSIPVTLTSLTLRGSSTSSALPAKITTFKLKDQISNATISGSGLSFSLANTSLPENYSRIYDIYANVGNVLTHESGVMTYGGYFTVKDTLGKVDIEIPIKEFSFSASP